jgi:hypothetical protein
MAHDEHIKGTLMTEYKETLVGSIAVDGKPVFDATFRLVSFALGNAGLIAAEVVIKREDERVYTMEIATQAVEAERATHNDTDDPPVQGGGPYVVEGPEILPSELMILKTTPIDLLMPYLVEQE